MKLSLKAGTTSKLIDLFIQDSSSTTGAGLTGLVYNTASLTGYYYREGAASAVAITLATMTLGTWATGGFVVIDGTNMPGCYQLGIPDAALAAGAQSVIVMLKGATNMAPLVLEIELTAIDNQDSVRAGLTALPNAAAEAAGGLFTRGTGAGQIAQQANGQIDANVSTIKTQAVTCAAGVTVLASVGTAATSTAQTGDNYARLGAPAGASLAADIASIKTDTGTTIPGRLPAALVSGRMDVSVGAYQTGLAPLQPTTAGRTLDVTATGEAGIDWANIGSPTATVNLSGTTVAAVSGAVGSVTGAVASVTGNVGGNVTGSVGSIAAGGIASTSFAAGAITAAAIAADAIGASELAADAAAEIAAACWDVTLSGHLTSGTTGAALNAAGSAGDPWGTALPGAYGAGSAGYLIGSYVNASIAAVKAKTDNLPSDPADASDISAAFSTVNATLATIDGRLDTEIPAIKAKTDLIPASPAATGDAMTLTAGERNSIADALLKRDWTAVTGEAARSLLNALRFLRNKWTNSAGTLTVMKEDDATTAWTATTTTAASDPVSSVDPS